MGSQDQSSFSMKVFAVLSVLAAACSANLPVPGSIPGLSIDQQYQYILQLQDHLNQQVQWNGRRKRSLPVPGTTGLVPGSAAEAQWYTQNLAQIALNNGRKKRSLLVPGSAAEAQWYQQNLAQIALNNGRKKRSLPVPGTIPGLVPGSIGEAQWYQAQLAALAPAGK